jgi:ribonucleotide reductase beta subunit family protein with ferritin-like domain
MTSQESQDNMNELTEQQLHQKVTDLRTRISTAKSDLGELRLQARDDLEADRLLGREQSDLNELKSELNQYEVQLEKFETILTENPQRFVVFPLQFHKVWEFYKRAVASFWTAEEITLSDDKVQWRKGKKAKLSDDDKHFIKHVLAFFAASDGIVNENLAENFYTEVQIPEARCFYGFQIAMENIHGEVYSLLIDTLVDDKEEKDKLFKAIDNFPSIKKLSDWALKWLRSDAPFNQRLIAFACVEGILFSGPFAAIFWLKKRGLLPGVTFSNELISRDENLHMEFACLLNSILKYPATKETITEIVKEAVAFEVEFINESLPCNLIGMNASEMTKYIQYVADRLLVMLGCEKHWNTKNPFGWMDLISTENMTNFFEKRVAEYNRKGFSKKTLQTTESPEGGQGIQILDDF